MKPLTPAVFAILTAAALSTRANAASYRTELWTASCTTGPAAFCQVYAHAIASALMAQRRVCLSTKISSLTLADVALRYKRLQSDKVPSSPSIFWSMPSRLPGPAPTESSWSRRDRLRTSGPATFGRAVMPAAPRRSMRGAL